MIKTIDAKTLVIIATIEEVSDEAKQSEYTTLGVVAQGAEF